MSSLRALRALASLRETACLPDFRAMAGFRSRITDSPAHAETKSPQAIRQPNSRRRRATLTPGKASPRPRSLKFEYRFGPRPQGFPTEPKTNLRNEPNLILCFQQMLKTKANFLTRLLPAKAAKATKSDTFDTLFKCVAYRGAADLGPPHHRLNLSHHPRIAPAPPRLRPPVCVSAHLSDTRSCALSRATSGRPPAAIR